MTEMPNGSLYICSTGHLILIMDPDRAMAMFPEVARFTPRYFNSNSDSDSDEDDRPGATLIFDG